MTARAPGEFGALRDWGGVAWPVATEAKQEAVILRKHWLMARGFGPSPLRSEFIHSSGRLLMPTEYWNCLLREQDLRALVLVEAQRTTGEILVGMSVELVVEKLPSLFRPLASLFD